MELLGIVAFFTFVIGTVLGLIVVIYFVKLSRQLLRLMDALIAEVERKGRNSGGIVFREEA